MFTNSFSFNRVNQTNDTVECIASIDTSTMRTSVTLSVTGNPSGYSVSR